MLVNTTVNFSSTNGDRGDNAAKSFETELDEMVDDRELRLATPLNSEALGVRIGSESSSKQDRSEVVSEFEASDGGVGGVAGLEGGWRGGGFAGRFLGRGAG